MIENLYGTTVQHSIGEKERGHVRTPPRTINREKAQTGRRNTIQMAVSMRHQFIGFLRGCIKAYRMRNAVLFREGNFSIQPIDAAGASINQMFHLIVTTAFQHI